MKDLSSRALRAFALMCMVSLGTATTAAAQSTASEIRALPVLVSSVAGKGSASFDWRAKKGPQTASAQKPRALTRVVHGRGRYVCSPAGFGRKSQCHSR
ncbi:hypothetical protein [Pontitalea aquivivens]|uniref:hypothetical protein n=1 Tax=Pontitalea aquivivens TaxID=3388663 RepID=UPI003970EB5E